ncbi:hypothetical protein GmHk_U059396 [Glycine max]|nr:hypothetical protein GmHk_U059396 [Glycine max]
MGSNPVPLVKKRFYQVKIKNLGVTSLKELGQLMGQLQRQAFRKAYGKIWDLTMAEVLHLWGLPVNAHGREFEEIPGCPLGGRKPYLFSGFYPSLARISKIVKISAQELDQGKQVKNGVVGVPRKCLEAKARALASQDEWAPFIDVLALLIFRVVLFPNVDGLVDLATIDAFLAFHDCKESPNSARIVFCTPALYVWLVSHLFHQEGRHVCPLEGHHSCIEKREANWFPRWKEGRTEILFSCGGFPNVPLMGMRGCINYNPILAKRQLGNPMRGAPPEEGLTPFIARGFNSPNVGILQGVCKACEMVQRKDKELRGSSNGAVGSYRRWLKVYAQGLDWLPRLRVVKEEEEKFKSTTIRIRKENAKLRDVNIATTKALEQETKRARKEEHDRNKFRGALWGSNNELKL